MAATKQKLGVLLSTGLEHPNLETAVGLSAAALDRGVELYLYLNGFTRCRRAARSCSSAPTAARSAASRCATPIRSRTAAWSC
jgi:hypothetical protein